MIEISKNKKAKGQTNLADKFANHAVPGAIGERCAILPVSNLVHVILEAQDLGQGIQDIDGEAFVRLGLAQNVLRHHHKRLLLSQQSEGDQLQTARRSFINEESLFNMNRTSGISTRGLPEQPGEETFTHIRNLRSGTFMKSSSGDL